MKQYLTGRRIAFFAAFAVIPAVVWAAEVRPTLNQRAGFVERQRKADVVQAANAKLPAQRDQLRAAWDAFEPTVSGSLERLADDLNPHLVQKRMFEVGRELGCTVKIARLASRDDEYFIRFSLIGEGPYAQMVRFVDELEQGQHFVRFERLTFDLPGLAAMEGERNVHATGVILVPAIQQAILEAAQ